MSKPEYCPAMTVEVVRGNCIGVWQFRTVDTWLVVWPGRYEVL